MNKLLKTMQVSLKENKIKNVIYVTVYIIRGSLVKCQIRYVADRCPRRQFETLISQ